MNYHFRKVLSRRLEAAESDAWRLWAIHRQSRTEASLSSYVSALRRCVRLQDALTGTALTPDIFPESLWSRIRRAAA